MPRGIYPRHKKTAAIFEKVQRLEPEQQSPESRIDELTHEIEILKYKIDDQAEQIRGLNAELLKCYRDLYLEMRSSR